jgi:hypothetical protein
MTLTQDQYDELTQVVINAVEQYANELITTAELVIYLTSLRSHLPETPDGLNGILDSNTGLRYPFNR